MGPPPDGQTSSEPGKKKPISKAAVSFASEPWMAFLSMEAAKSLRIVPGSAFAGRSRP